LLSRPAASQQRKRLVEYGIIHHFAPGGGSYFTGKLTS
jgi:hypothetical protein